MNDPFPLGVPINRPPAPGLVPVPGRPGWWRNPRSGTEQYIEPPKKTVIADDDYLYPYVGDEE